MWSRVRHWHREWHTQNHLPTFNHADWSALSSHRPISQGHEPQGPPTPSDTHGWYLHRALGFLLQGAGTLSCRKRSRFITPQHLYLNPKPREHFIHLKQTVLPGFVDTIVCRGIKQHDTHEIRASCLCVCKQIRVLQPPTNTPVKSSNLCRTHRWKDRKSVNLAQPLSSAPRWGLAASHVPDSMSAAARLSGAFEVRRSSKLAVHPGPARGVRRRSRGSNTGIQNMGVPQTSSSTICLQ